MDLTPEKLLENLRSGKAPQEVKLALARGAVPLGPSALLEILILLTSDTDGEVKKAAVGGLRKVPRSVVLGVCAAPDASRSLLHRLSRLFAKQEDILQKIVLNPAVSDETIALIADLPYTSLLEIIGRNQVRLDRAPAIAGALKDNPATPATVRSLLEEDAARKKKPVSVEPPAAGEEDEGVEEIPEVLIEEVEGGTAASVVEAKVVEQQKATIQQVLKGMSAGQKVALAMKGNGEVRKILVRDKNRLICEKVLENPRITDSEIEGISKSTNVSEDVLRIIGNTREWVSQPAIMRSLISNPRTPIALSLGFLKRLSLKDLEGLSKNRNVPEALRNTARKMHKLKLESRGK